MIIDEQCGASAAVIVAVLYVVEPGIREVQPLGRQVEGEGVGPVHLLRDYGLPLTSIQARHLDAREAAPV